MAQYLYLYYTLSNVEEMYYRLYIITWTKNFEDVQNEKIGRDMALIYLENNVSVIGDWVDKNAKNTSYLFIGYRDKQHYQDFIELMKTNTTYQVHAKYLQQVRVGVQSIELESTKWNILELQPVLIQNYLSEVANQVGDEPIL